MASPHDSVLGSSLLSSAPQPEKQVLASLGKWLLSQGIAPQVISQLDLHDILQQVLARARDAENPPLPPPVPAAAGGEVNETSLEGDVKDEEKKSFTTIDDYITTETAAGGSTDDVTSPLDAIFTPLLSVLPANDAFCANPTPSAVNLLHSHGMYIALRLASAVCTIARKGNHSATATAWAQVGVDLLGAKMWRLVVRDYARYVWEEESVEMARMCIWDVVGLLREVGLKERDARVRKVVTEMEELAGRSRMVPGGLE